MGALYQHNVQEYITKYNLNNYVETGTGAGDCLRHALQFNFSKLRSVEIYPQIFERVNNGFSDDRVKIYLGNSYEKMQEMVQDLDGNTLFFLDAHFPGADFHFETYTSTEDYHTRLPLEREVRNLVNLRDTSNDVIIIDDLRVYEDNNYSDGNWPLRSQAGGNGVEFIYELFGQTHIIEKDLRFQGFLIITPNKSI
jgi:hypothetical protein